MQYGVGRDSLREALRILEVQGLITIHRGPGGGPKVAGIDPAYLACTATLYFHLSGATYDEMFETWFMIEPAVAEKVAALPDRPRVRRSLEPFVAELPPDVDTDVFFTMSTGFHAGWRAPATGCWACWCRRSATSSTTSCWTWIRSRSVGRSNVTTARSPRRSPPVGRRRRAT